MEGKSKALKNLDKETEKMEKNFAEFEASVKNLTTDQLNATPKEETEPQAKLSQKQISESKDIYLKPKRSVSGRDKFNEKFRKEYEYDKEYVKFIAENNELIGQGIEIWTKPYSGVPAEYWEVPTNKPIWGPRYLAEQIKRKFYHRLKMQEGIVGSSAEGTYYGQMVADTTVQRLDARPASTRKSIFMSAGNF